MAAERQLVLDANILIRAVLGRRVRQIITDHAEHASFFAPAAREPRRGAFGDWRRGGDDAAGSDVAVVASAPPAAVARVRPWMRRTRWPRTR